MERFLSIFERLLLKIERFLLIIWLISLETDTWICCVESHIHYQWSYRKVYVRLGSGLAALKLSFDVITYLIIALVAAFHIKKLCGFCLRCHLPSNTKHPHTFSSPTIASPRKHPSDATVCSNVGNLVSYEVSLGGSDANGTSTAAQDQLTHRASAATDHIERGYPVPSALRRHTTAAGPSNKGRADVPMMRGHGHRSRAKPGPILPFLQLFGLEGTPLCFLWLIFVQLKREVTQIQKHVD